jgi:hypothetical protein
LPDVLLHYLQKGKAISKKQLPRRFPLFSGQKIRPYDKMKSQARWEDLSHWPRGKEEVKRYEYSNWNTQEKK